jgi:hypothetical protein
MPVATCAVAEKLTDKVFRMPSIYTCTLHAKKNKKLLDNVERGSRGIPLANHLVVQARRGKAPEEKEVVLLQ